MGCKRCQKKIKEDGTLEPKFIYYFYCLSCEELKATRLFETQTVGYRCKKCGGKTLKFQRPPSMHKLRAAKAQRMG